MTAFVSSLLYKILSKVIIHLHNINKMCLLVKVQTTQIQFWIVVFWVMISFSPTLVNTQNVSVTKIVDSSSIQCAESKYGLRIQFLALVVMIHEVWLNMLNSYLGRNTCVSIAFPDGE
jgi:hypothetical protein